MQKFGTNISVLKNVVNSVKDFTIYSEDARKVIILFTDGISGDDYFRPAKQLRELKQVKIYVVNISDGATTNSELQQIIENKDSFFRWVERAESFSFTEDIVLSF